MNKRDYEKAIFLRAVRERLHQLITAYDEVSTISTSDDPEAVKWCRKYLGEWERKKPMFKVLER